MYKSVKQASLFLATTLFVFCFSASISSPAFAHSAASSNSPVSSKMRASADAKKAVNYWTPTRMRSARPADELVSLLRMTPQKAPEHTLSATDAKSSGSKPPVAPQHANNAPSTGILSKNISPKAYSLPHSYYPYFPYSTIGKVFFTDSRTGYNYVCSGTAVNSNNKSVVDTAGHCVNQGGRSGNWYTNWIFCPQYYYGSGPYGCWGARQLWTSYDWYYNGSLEDDFGEAVMAPNYYGYLVNVVGGTGWAYGQSAYQYFYAFGYPAAYPFNGQSIYYCPSYGTPYGFDDSYVVSISCDMTGGSSGGPWLISINGTFGYVNGHNDFKYSNDSYHMYSPYYDSDWYAVFNAAQNS